MNKEKINNILILKFRMIELIKSDLDKSKLELDQFKEDKLLIEKNLTDSKETVNELNLKLNELEQLKQAREKALLNKEAKRKLKEEAEEAVKKELEGKIQAEKKAIEEKIVKKALSIKKKEIKKQEILDEISDDETPIEQIKVPVKKEPNLKVKTNKTLYFD